MEGGRPQAPTAQAAELAEGGNAVTGTVEEYLASPPYRSIPSPAVPFFQGTFSSRSVLMTKERSQSLVFFAGSKSKAQNVSLAPLVTPNQMACIKSE